jgi:hypothetical protein
VLLSGDKNTDLCIVSINWVTKQANKHLLGPRYKMLNLVTIDLTCKNTIDTYFLSLNIFFKQYYKQIQNFSPGIYDAILPYRTIYQIGIPFQKSTKIPSQLGPSVKLSIPTPHMQVKSLTIFSKNLTFTYLKYTLILSSKILSA